MGETDCTTELAVYLASWRAEGDAEDLLRERMRPGMV